MFTINDETWRVKFVSPFHPMMFRSDGSQTIGACDDETKTIYINVELDEQMIRKVLCHEVTHAAMFSYNVEISLMEEELLADLFATYGQEIIDITNRIFLRLKEKRGS